jgi:hydrogenase maturation protein HypF
VTEPLSARRIRVRGVVQGVGLRPYVARLADEHGVSGWVLNDCDGVQIHIEGPERALDAFLNDLNAQPPPAARIASIEVSPARFEASHHFEIHDSRAVGKPTTRISPDLPVCDDCLRELRDPANRRRGYPYINCTNCGPRYSIVRALPYDRSRTTMARWPMCEACAAEYHNPSNRRFHAQPTACPACGPSYHQIEASASALRAGQIVAVKGIGGYHLACDADNAAAVETLRARKFRKEKPFAVMVRDLTVAHRTAVLTTDAEALLRSSARPIVLAPARTPLAGVAPDNREIGVMLPYAPIHHLLFASGAPERLVMTSGNRSSEPIAYEDEDARERLSDLADALLVGDRPIARRMDDSVVRAGVLGPMVLRRSRGLTPAVVARVPHDAPVLAVGGDLKNAMTLLVDGQAFVTQHIGDLEHYESLRAFDETIRDFLAMYGVKAADLVLAHDAHPQYASTAHALTLNARHHVAVQHHRAHVASVLAEREAFDTRVIGVAFDGTGYGDDGSIWGGEVFVGSILEGFERVAHLRPAVLPGGDAAAREPVQAAAGFLSSLSDLPDLTAPPFEFSRRYLDALQLARSGVREFPTTSAGRLFDTVAALLGFTRSITFEGQAAMWLERLARGAGDSRALCPMPSDGARIDWCPTLAAVIRDRRAGVDPAIIARAFHRCLADAVAACVADLASASGIRAAVLSGGVFQNDLLVADIHAALGRRASGGIEVWLNRNVPPNDGGLSLGQAALAVRQTAGPDGVQAQARRRAGRRDPPCSH